MEVISKIESLHLQYLYSGGFGFKESVQRIELLSTVLIEPEPSPLKYNASLSKATGSVNTQAQPKEPS